MTEEHVKETSGPVPARRNWWVLAAIAVVAVLAAVALVLLPFADNRPEVTFEELRQVVPGMSKVRVIDILGPGETGSFEDNVGNEWKDCWFYTVARSGQPGYGVVCFRANTVDSVTYPL